MTNFWGKNCSFGLLYMCFVDLYEFMCTLLCLLVLIVLIPDHYLSNYFDIKRHLNGFSFIMHDLKTLRHEESQRSKKQTLFCPKLLTSRMHYDISWRRH